MSPIFFSCLNILSHNAIGDCSPHRVDITFDKVFGDRVYSFQEPLCKGNKELKVCSNVLLEFVKILLVNEREAISAILFCSPWMPTVNSGAVWCTWSLVASALRS